jgi:hypothetical protein
VNYGKGPETGVLTIDINPARDRWEATLVLWWCSNSLIDRGGRYVNVTK